MANLESPGPECESAAQDSPGTSRGTAAAALTLNFGAGGVARTAVLVGFVAVTAKLAAMGKDLLVAHRYGMGDDLDSYFLALAINLFIIGITAGSLMPAFIPVYVRTFSARGRHEGARLLSSSLAASALILCVISLVVAAMAPKLVALLAGGFDAPKAGVTVMAIRIMVLMIPFGGLSAILSGGVNVSGKYAAPAVVPVVTPVVMILMIFFSGPRAGSIVLASGTSAGLGIETMLLLAMAWRRGILGVPSPGSVMRELRSVAGQYAPLAAGATMTAGAALIDGSMAAGLGSGCIAILRYGSKLVVFAMEILGLSLTTSLLPAFSKITDDHGKPRNGGMGAAAFFRCLGPVLLLTVPLAAVLYLSSETVVRILLERGRFSASDTLAVSEIQKIFAIQVPFFAVSLIGVRMLSAMLRSRIVLLVSGIDFAVKISLNLLLCPTMGIKGLAIATTVMHAVSAVVLTAILLACPCPEPLKDRKDPVD